MATEIAFENGRISNFEGLVTLNLTLGHTFTHMPNVIEIEETYCGRTYGRMSLVELKPVQWCNV